MMPLMLARVGEENTIKKIGGKADIRQFLENLGFVPGTHVTVVTENGGNVIVSIKESRVAISREMAGKIIV
ncbi:MAG: ferrous iron transport protein A [Oscillospiraceae bacterium]|nr:ferrous iron transport protein A [Oscillospiraceae bacterium]